MFEFFIYKSRGSVKLSFSAFFHIFSKIKNLEKGTVLRNPANTESRKFIKNLKWN